MNKHNIHNRHNILDLHIFKCKKCNNKWMLYNEEIAGVVISKAWIDRLAILKLQTHCEISNEEYNFREILA